MEIQGSSDETFVVSTSYSSADEHLESGSSKKEHQGSTSKSSISSSSRVRHRQHERTTTREENEENELKYDAHHVITVVLPVSFCMAVVTLTMNTLNYYKTTLVYLPYTPFIAKSNEVSELLWKSVLNGLIFIVGVAVLTFSMILLYKYRFYTFLKTWLLLSSLILLFVFSAIYLQEVFKTFNVPVDYFTMFFILWNFSLMGLICIHWIGPLRVQQIYLVIISALMALTFIKYLPDWTVWSVLFLVAVWDLFAVLSPRGPLRILIEIAQSRDESLFPSLIYSSAMVYSYIASGTAVANYGSIGNEEQSSLEENQISSSEGAEAFPPDKQDLQINSASSPSTHLLSHSGSDSHPVNRYAPHRHVKVTIKGNNGSESVVVQEEAGTSSSQPSDSAEGSVVPPNRSMLNPKVKVAAAGSKRPRSVGNHGGGRQEEPEERGVKLGLGDFIFYSVLVGKASSFSDWNTTAACYVGILIGLCFTLILLAIFRKALPALPISIAFGLVFYVSTRALISPFCEQLTVRQIVF